MSEFVHLNCHSEYSIENGLIRIPKLIEKAKKLNMKSIALTDNNNLFTAVKFYQEAINNQIKPIFGAKLKLKSKEHKYSLLLLCKDYQGYLNLSQLLTLSYLENENIDRAYVDDNQLAQHCQGLIMIVLPIVSDIAQFMLNKKAIEAEKKIKFWQDIFADNLYLGVQRTKRINEENNLHLFVDLGLQFDIPLVAMNDVQFLQQDDFEAHEIRVCISQGGLLDDSRRKKIYSNEQYLKSQEQMAKIFSDLPEALANSVEISKRCNVHFELNKKHYLPNFPVPKGLSIEEFFSKQAEQELEKYIVKNKLDKELYQKRLQFELSVIIDMKFAGYFLIVADFIGWSKNNDIPVGPGRGSGAGSLVAYVLKITDIDPIKYGLLFERFLNPERVSMPDFDIDFCTKGRDDVVKYVADKYGKEKVAQIITYGTMAAKGVVRDVGRVLGHPYNFVDKIAKLIPNVLNITLSQALGFTLNDDDNSEKSYSKDLKDKYDSDESIKILIDLSLKLEGLVRNVGTHAGGVLIAPSKISDFCPAYKGPNDNDVVVSQFDMKDIEALGLVKFDFLGLSNLTVIDKTIKLINKKISSDKQIDIKTIALDDKKVYKLLQKCDTTGIFQLESPGMRAYLKKLKPDSFDDIVALLALYRPGPLDSGMVDDYINVKHNKQKAQYPHQMLKTILKPTNGVFVYQEQVMQSAQLMSGYSLGNADLLRRAMGKKNPKEMEDQREKFIQGAFDKKIDKKTSNQVFDLIYKFSGYGFNKSHSVAYAYISYQTAWLKTHYLAAFMASLLSEMMQDTDRISVIVKEIKNSKIKIIAPNLNKSSYEFDAKDKENIIYGLGAIKGIGKSLAIALTKERKANGDYKDLFDFCARIEKKYLNKGAIESLIYSGSLDCFGIDRASLIKTYPNAIKQSEQKQNDYNSGQNDLFADINKRNEYYVNYLKCTDLSFKEIIKFEKRVIGYYFNHHPIDQYKKDLKLTKSKLPSELNFVKNQEVKVLAMIAKLQYIYSQQGRCTVNLILEDNNKKLNAVIFNDLVDKVRDKLILDEVVLVSGKINKNFRKEWQLVVNQIENIDIVKKKYIKCLQISLNSNHNEIFEKLVEILTQHKGNCPVNISYAVDDVKANIYVGKEYLIDPTQELVDKINNLAKDCIGRFYL